MIYFLHDVTTKEFFVHVTTSRYKCEEWALHVLNIRGKGTDKTDNVIKLWTRQRTVGACQMGNLL